MARVRSIDDAAKIIDMGKAICVRVKSKSGNLDTPGIRDDGTWNVIYLPVDGSAICHCPGFRRSMECNHTKRVKLFFQLVEEGFEPQEAKQMTRERYGV